MVAELLFGLGIAGNPAVTPAAFDAFVAADIAPRFPDGMTVLPASGAWRAPDGQRVSEGSRMVVIVAPDDASTAERLHAIRAAYRARFAQKSVGLITIQSCASF